MFYVYSLQSSLITSCMYLTNDFSHLKNGETEAQRAKSSRQVALRGELEPSNSCIPRLGQGSGKASWAVHPWWGWQAGTDTSLAWRQPSLCLIGAAQGIDPFRASGSHWAGSGKLPATDFTCPLVVKKTKSHTAGSEPFCGHPENCCLNIWVW